jgi:methylmalonyl-CoA mutase N-terminal domain/subunit
MTADRPGYTELPGVFPFTRGTLATGPDPAGWFGTYYTGAGTSVDTNRLFKDRFTSAAGVPNLLLAMDLPTQVGFDPDAELAIGEVGRVGVAVSSLQDMLDVFDGIGLDRVTSGTVGNSIGIYTCPLFEAAGRRGGVSADRMRITLQNDPLKEYTGRGTQIFPVETALQLSIDVVEYVHRKIGPSWKPQYTCSTQMRWGGVSAAQEIGFGLSNMLTYVQAAQARAIEPTEYLSHTDLHMSSDENLLGEIAKFRAARRTWALLLEKRYGRSVAERSPLNITVFTAGNRLTAQRPLNNIVRTTTHILAAMLGGVSEMLVPGYDEALGLPTREATALTNSTKQILFHESGVGTAVDPLGGSQELERLTDAMTEEALHWIDVVEGHGGMLNAIATGFIDDAMTEGTLRRQIDIETNEQVIVGLNYGDVAPAPPLEIFRGNPDAEQQQIERVANLRRTRSGADVLRSLKELQAGATRKSNDMSYNLIPDVGTCIDAFATVGEIFLVLRDVFGEAQVGQNASSIGA